MIFILVTRAHAYTLRRYLAVWGQPLRGKLAPLYYDDLVYSPPLAPGTYIFADLERLDDTQLELAQSVWRQLAARPESFRLFNDPSRVLRRFELLRALHAAGVNQFAAYALDDADKVRFPAFLRRASEHDGALSPLLNSRAELDRAAAELLAGGAPRGDVIVVEYCDTGDDAGVYRKYSAFRVGERILSRHIFHSRKWMLKKADLVEPHQVEEELVYVRDNPHEAQLRTIFGLANVEYGRVDYALKDGRVQVWEINTNPTITVPPSQTAPSRLLAQGMFAEQFLEAMKQIDDDAQTGEPLKLRLPRELTRRLRTTPADRARRQLARAIRWLAKRPFVQRYE